MDDALSRRGDDYFLLRSKGAVLWKLGQDKEASELFDQVLKIKPDDYESLRSKGVCLSNLGQEREAIELFDQVLTIKPDDYHALRNKGVSLSKLGQEKEAIELYDRALKINPDDYDALGNKGVSLSKLGQEKEAIELFDRALTIKPDDYNALLNKGVSLFKLAQYEKAYKNIRHAYEKGREQDQRILTRLLVLLNYVERYLNKQITVPPHKGTGQVAADKPQRTELAAVVKLVQDRMSDKFEMFLGKMKDTEKNYLAFLAMEASFSKDLSIFLHLRKWNSFTPSIPIADEERHVGGGYFIYHNGKGTVIDPGYDFIENFYNAGGRVHDIDNIVITHAHNDHTIDFESLLTLVHEYNSYNGLSPESPEFKRVDVYMNTGALVKFSGMLDLRGSDYINMVHTLSPGLTYHLGDGMKMKTLAAYHDERITARKYAVGLKFTFSRENESRIVLLTSDTGLFPQVNPPDKDGATADITGDEVWRTYEIDGQDIDALIVHIGSIKNQEFQSTIGTDENKIYYPNHLGMIGTARVITAVKPRLAIISEFGEELSGILEDLIDVIRKIVNEYFRDKGAPKVLPGDLSLIYNIWDRTIYCIGNKEMVPMERIKALVPGSIKEFCYFADGCREVDVPDYANQFKADRKERNLPHLNHTRGSGSRQGQD